MDLILNINKNPGHSSFSVIRKLKSKYNLKKCGYTGTLDPFASGVLPVFCGNFTKLIPFIQNKIKTYRFNIAFGYETDSLDITGEVVKRTDSVSVSLKNIEETIERCFSGVFMQRPPRFSALKVNGRRAYKMAKQGKEFTMDEKEVKLLEYNDIKLYEGGFTGSITVESGFYVRAFARDIGRELGTPATLVQLERTADSFFDISGSVSEDTVSPGDSIDIEQFASRNMIMKYASGSVLSKLRNGMEVFDPDLPEGRYMMADREMETIIIADAGEHIIKTKRVIR
ncbi:MAG: tRNA pseudouridine(55) synthase TruB [bacterium]